MSTLTQCAPVAPWSNRPERKSQQTCELLTNLELQQCQSGTALASRKPLRWVIIYTHFSGTLCEAKYYWWNMMCNSAKRVFVCACKGAWQVGRVSLPNQLLKRLCRNAQVFLFHWKQSHFPSGQVRLEPRESSGSLRRYFTRHDNTNLVLIFT